jgi:hypothetical protein
MQCENENILIEQNDFACVGEVARHCDLKKLCIGIGEAQEFDLSNLFCDFCTVILDIWQEIELYQEALAEYQACVDEGGEECIEPEAPEDYELKLNLICGGTFEGCNGKTRNHLGVKRILVYYSYARYVLINSMNDTPNGGVTKTNDFSIPIAQKDLEKISDRYRTMGYESYKKTLNFICTNKEDLGYEGKCGGCGCGDDDCRRETKAKGYGFNGSIIKKKIWDV